MSAAAEQSEISFAKDEDCRVPGPSGPAKVSRELLIVLGIFAVSALLNLLFASQRMALGLYLLPTIFSAYHYGRRHAVLTASFSVFLVVLLFAADPAGMQDRLQAQDQAALFDIAAWSGLLIVTAYAVGTLHERTQAALRDLRQSYQGILRILEHITSDQKYSQSHPQRVSMCATQIAEEMNLGRERVEDVRACALLHEIEKLGITRDLLQQAAGLDGVEGPDGSTIAEGGSLRRLVAILSGFEEALKTDGDMEKLAPLPIEARILHVADVYDSLTASGSRNSPSEAMERIAQRAGLDYDQEVVDAFVRVFRRRARGTLVTA